MKNSQDSKQFFSFKEQLQNAVKICKNSDPIVSNDEDFQPQPILADVPGSFIQQKSDMVTHYETSQFLVYGFALWRATSTVITVQIFNKIKGTRHFQEMPQVQKMVTVMRFTQMVEQYKGKTTSALMLVMGCKDGFIKMVSFGKLPKIQPYRIDCKQIIDIKIGQKNAFREQNICFVLTQDNKVFTVSLNIQHQQVIGHFHPVIMMCQQPLAIQMHYSNKYLLQSTKGGYLLIWKLNQQLLKNKLKSSNKVYNVSPIVVLLAPTLEGIIWTSFYGDFIAVVTTEGILKIISINLEDKEKQEHVVIFEHQIKQPKSIRNVVVFEKEQCFIVLKKVRNRAFLQCIFLSVQLRIIEVLEITLSEGKRQMSFIDDFMLSQDYQIVMARNRKQFFVNCIDFFKKKLTENAKRNQEYKKIPVQY